MSLIDTIQTALSTAEKLKASGAANEANTKALVIEPVVGALGWNLADFQEVDREYKVFDGTFLDYALRVDGRPRLFVEAKAAGKSLADKQFIAQTVNCANNEGVVWCVLTNGVTYQVYKSNEPVAMDRKMLFEVDLLAAQADGDLAQAVRSLGLLAKSAVAANEIDRWAESIFTDIRVRAALATLAESSPDPLVQLVADALEGPKIQEATLARSLGRILGQVAGGATNGVVGVAPAGAVAPTAPSPVRSKGGLPKTVYSVEHHTSKKPASIVDLFEKVDAFAHGLGPDVDRRATKYYVGYYAGKKSFFTLELQKAKVWVYLSLPPTEVDAWDDGVMRDVRDIGHFGMGDTEFRLTASEQLPALEALLKTSYLRNRK